MRNHNVWYSITIQIPSEQSPFGDSADKKSICILFYRTFYNGFQKELFVETTSLV